MRTSEVERLEAFVNHEGDAVWVHGTTFRPEDRWRQRHVPHKSRHPPPASTPTKAE
ncbi:hypothetical protein [Nonomuraea sp. NPDC049725]|uniref:hypothetical protein n=1 Tax=Nonomuraea sp. NPDC049725 TaxID=3154508 RepID=UPI00343E3305